MNVPHANEKPATVLRSIGLVLPPCEAIKKRGGKCGMPAKYEICERDDDPTPVCSLHQTVAATHGWKTRKRQNAALRDGGPTTPESKWDANPPFSPATCSPDFMKTQIMLDLETLGNKPGSVIVAIGAVKFGGGEILDSFYERVDAESCVNLGLRMDVSTVLWWMNQNDAARKEITRPGGKLSEVLLRFSTWVNDLDAEVWGNGASFDNVLLSDAYDRAQLPRPWKYYNDRCYRTVKNLRPEVPMARGGTHHNALDDAKSQATHLMAMIQGNTELCNVASPTSDSRRSPKI